MGCEAHPGCGPSPHPPHCPCSTCPGPGWGGPPGAPAGRPRPHRLRLVRWLRLKPSVHDGASWACPLGVHTEIVPRCTLGCMRTFSLSRKGRPLFALCWYGGVSRAQEVSECCRCVSARMRVCTESPELPDARPACRHHVLVQGQKPGCLKLAPTEFREAWEGREPRAWSALAGGGV